MRNPNKCLRIWKPFKWLLLRVPLKLPQSGPHRYKTMWCSTQYHNGFDPKSCETQFEQVKTSHLNGSFKLLKSMLTQCVQKISVEGWILNPPKSTLTLDQPFQTHSQYPPPPPPFFCKIYKKMCQL